MAISLLEYNGNTVDFSVNETANKYYHEVMQMEGESLSWQELDRWFHLIYHPLRREFHERVNVYRKKLAQIRASEKQSPLSVIDYLKLSLLDVGTARRAPPPHQRYPVMTCLVAGYRFMTAPKGAT